MVDRSLARPRARSKRIAVSSVRYVAMVRRSHDVEASAQRVIASSASPVCRRTVRGRRG